MKAPMRKALGLAVMLGLGITSQAQAATCTYAVSNEWNTGFTGTITITNNTTTAINGWTVGWQYSANRMTGSWNATVTGSNPYSATNLSWNSSIQPGQSVNFGFQGNKNNSLAAEKPTVTGAVCSGSNTSVAASSRPASSRPASSRPVTSIAASSRPVTSIAASSRPVTSVAASSRPASSRPASSRSASSTATTAGTFRVNSTGSITKNGTVLPVHCGAWFGLEGQFEPKDAANNAGGAPMELYVGNMWWAATGRTIQQTMTEIKAQGINVIRLPIAPQTLDATDPQGMGDIQAGGVLKNAPSVRQTNARQALEDFIKLADKNNLQLIIDIHSCSNYVGWRKGRLDAKPPYVDATRVGYEFTREEWSCSATGNPSTVTNIQAYNETIWLNNLKTIAGFQKSLGVTNILAIDIFNEPWDYTWAEWKALSDKAYTAINSVNTDVLIMVEGVGSALQNGTKVDHGVLTTNPNWGENLYGMGTAPLAIPKERLILSPHTYGPSVFVQQQVIDQSKAGCAGLEGDAAGDAKCQIVISPAILEAGWEEHFGFLRDQGYAIVTGEFGGNMDWPKESSTADQTRWSHITTNVDQQWQNAYVSYMKKRGIEACYWSINPESSDTHGLYLHSYSSSNEAGWGTWLGFDTRKTSLLNTLWN